jgi:hypothetical protein
MLSLVGFGLLILVIYKDKKHFLWQAYACPFIDNPFYGDIIK